MDNPHPRLRSRLRRALYAKTPEELAYKLFQKGVRGMPRNAFLCPLARYIASLPFVRSPGSVAIGRNTVNVDGVSVPLPPAAKQMVLSFDEGQFKSLCIERRIS